MIREEVVLILALAYLLALEILSERMSEQQENLDLQWNNGFAEEDHRRLLLGEVH